MRAYPARIQELANLWILASLRISPRIPERINRRYPMPRSEICRQGSYAQSKEDKALGGHVAGLLTRDRRIGIHNPARRREWASQGGAMSCHRKWHLARGIINPQCSLCIQNLD